MKEQLLDDGVVVTREELSARYTCEDFNGEFVYTNEGFQYKSDSFSEYYSVSDLELMAAIIRQLNEKVARLDQ